MLQVPPCAAPAFPSQGLRRSRAGRIGRTWSTWSPIAVLVTRVARAVHTELLVDADGLGLRDIKRTRRLLESRGFDPNTKVFALKERCRRSRWQMLSKDPKVELHSVEAGPEATDVALSRQFEELSKTPTCLALLIDDAGYLGQVSKALAQTLPPLVIVVLPERSWSLQKAFAAVGARTWMLRGSSCGHRVRAMLGGGVRLASSFVPEDAQNELDVVKSFLADLGYGNGQWLPAAAKFWAHNGLGLLTVFPSQFAIHAVREVATAKGFQWKRPGTPVAFLLPRQRRRDVLTAPEERLYGSALAAEIFHGGGPHLLSGELIVQRGLRRLGYMENDLSEAMLVFLNQTQNRGLLQKLGCEIKPSDRASDVEEKLRAAFISDESTGHWRIAPQDFQVRQHLRRRGFLRSGKESRETVFKAMERYCRQHKLTAMKTYGGYVYRIKFSLPTHRLKATDFQL